MLRTRFLEKAGSPHLSGLCYTSAATADRPAKTFKCEHQDNTCIGEESMTDGVG